MIFSIWAVSLCPQSPRKKAIIHQVSIMLATSKKVLFPGHDHLLTTGRPTDDPSRVGAWAIIKVSVLQYRWLAGGYEPGNRTFLEVTSMVVTPWIVGSQFLCNEWLSPWARFIVQKRKKKTTVWWKPNAAMFPCIWMFLADCLSKCIPWQLLRLQTITGSVVILAESIIVWAALAERLEQYTCINLDSHKEIQLDLIYHISSNAAWVSNWTRHNLPFQINGAYYIISLDFNPLSIWTRVILSL